MPIITLTSDFGLGDFYVAAMKARLLRACPGAQLVDVTHLVPRHEVLSGAICLERAIGAFEPETFHLAVVDPGVGSGRRLLVGEIGGQVVVCPDNGLITWAWRRIGGGKAHELIWRPAGVVSDVFHGRDILAPAAGMLASGVPVGELAAAIDDPVLLDLAPSSSGERGAVVYIDRFGNAMTNVPAELLGRAGEVRVKGQSVGRLRRTYSDVAVGEPLALVGSSGLLEIAVREGSAMEVLGVGVGDEVKTEVR